MIDVPYIIVLCVAITEMALLSWCLHILGSRRDLPGSRTSFRLPQRISSIGVSGAFLLVLHALSALLVEYIDLKVVEYTLLYTLYINSALIFYCIHEYCHSMWRAFLMPANNTPSSLSTSICTLILVNFNHFIMVVIVVCCLLITFYNNLFYSGIAEFFLSACTIGYYIFFLVFEIKFIQEMQRKSKSAENEFNRSICFHIFYTVICTIMCAAVTVIQVMDGYHNVTVEGLAYLTNEVRPPRFVWAHLGCIMLACIFVLRSACNELTASSRKEATSPVPSPSSSYLINNSNKDEAIPPNPAFSSTADTKYL